jgi:hypothetical protein
MPSRKSTAEQAQLSSAANLSRMKESFGLRAVSTVEPAFAVNSSSRTKEYASEISGSLAVLDHES